VVWEDERRLAGGAHRLLWAPDADTPVGSYALRLTVEDEGGRRRVYGSRRPATVARGTAPVVRVLGVEAAFERRSYLPAEPMRLTVLADTESLRLTFLRVGHEPESTLRNDELSGLEVGQPVEMSWLGKRSAPATVTVQSGEWPSGLYAVRLETPDGRIGFAPFVLRPATLGTVRQAVVLPTNTWQAYNFYDADGDGWGDTWYAGGSPPVVLDRPYLKNGVPPRFKKHDRAFLRWLALTRRDVDVLADDDLERARSGRWLRERYDLVVFPGHTEYVTEHAYDVVEEFRDRGGNLMFLSANNFFWKVEKRARAMRRVAIWRALGRPEAQLVGVQYLANDDGTRQAPFVVRSASRMPWLWDGTGLADGDTFGEFVGGFGTEIDAVTRRSPRGTTVAAEIPDLFGRGFTAQMTYYEAPSGARVFAAGALDFGGAVTLWPMRRILQNVWNHLAPPGQVLGTDPGDP
ncbi:MAG TPA: N,N-dimethylformamidase beta subunit family domain-containing protein, partial [Gaiellaceae bacterium]|nr:N,N-dimethylformamidase beta subunit family domain-containing protein [Gaiellaceae bacterium]